MNLSVVRDITQKHLTETRAHLAHIATLEPVSILTELPLEAKILNGLYYVQLYSALERTVNEVAQRTLSSISAVSIQNNHVQSSFCVVSLFAEMMSLRDSRNRNLVVKATDMFSRQTNRDAARINETCLSQFLQNIWMKTIDELFDAFGIQRLNLSPRIRTTVDEITENRNKIAHGRENASIIGERHRSPVLREKTDQVEALLYSIIDTFENFYIRKGFIKPVVRNKYLIGSQS